MQEAQKQLGFFYFFLPPSMPKKTTTASTWKNKANKSRKETDLERATKRAQAVLGDKVVFCEKCNKPKMPDILRTGNPEREKGFCKC